MTRLKALEAVAQAARKRYAFNHPFHDEACSYSHEDGPCDCGQKELGEALALIDDEIRAALAKLDQQN